MNKHRHVVINNKLDIAMFSRGEYVLSDIRTDKDTKDVYLVTRADYSSEINLIADVVNFFVKRSVFFKSITTIDEMKKESGHVAEICRGALSRLNKSREQ
ncbi:DUF5405 family protein [Edaphovirga cremea]|uniref:DUF5405 family protein n=1 Tax=Edaphovirga cremea TaxID=2267246 RepID=UPI000DEF3AD7|nr:DUF5405 family protein [Edaphovirga cremea]